MKFSATELLQRQAIAVNPKTQTELEQRWTGIQALKKQIKSDVKNDFDISLVNTAGADHVK